MSMACNTFASEEECLPGLYEDQVGVMLGLEEEQVQALASLRCDYKPRLAEAQSQIEMEQKKFREKVKNENDEQVIREAFASVAAAEEQIVVLQVMLHQDTRKLFTEEQDELMEAFLDVQYLQNSVAKGKRQAALTGSNYVIEQSRE
jgi:hypothetical protein